MAKKQNIKTIIKKKIEITKTGSKVLIGKTHVDNYKEKKIRKEPSKINNMNDRLSQRSAIQKKNNQYSDSNQSRIEKRSHKIKSKNIINYVKKIYVDYDVVICIPSHDRYDKLIRIVEALYNQETKYRFKIIILNDGSIDIRYKQIKELYDDIEYIENNTPNGKIYHWYCYNQLWNFLKKIECHAVLQMDDDFILCDDFLNKITDLFFEKKKIDSSILAISPHLWSFKEISDSEGWWKTNHIDGIALLDSDIIKKMEFKMLPVDVEIVKKTGQPVRTWSQILDAIISMGGKIYRTEKSLVYHDGNDDSKLHGDARKDGKGGVYTQKYIGNI